MAAPSLTNGPVGGHIRTIALPISIGFFFHTMYNVVDSFFAGRISTSALAAMALSFPVFFLIIAISEGFARGASALIANAIGAGDKESESELSTQIFSLGIVTTLALTVIGLTISSPIFAILGANSETLEIANAYIRPLFWGCGAFLLGSLSNAVLLAHGDSRTYGKVLVASFFLNLIFDPWFLYGGFGLPAMGIAGIAWATVLIQVISGLFLFYAALKKGAVSFTGVSDLAPNPRVFGSILKQGLPTSFNMMSIALGFFVTTYFLQHYGESAVAAFGVGTRIEQIALLPSIGLGAAIVAVVGQNNGARKFERVREAVQLCLKYGLVLILTASILVFAFAKPLVQLFTKDPEVIRIGTEYTRIMASIQWVYVMSSIHLGFLQAVKRPLYGFFESVIRKLILPFGIFYLIVDRLQVELNTLWYSICAINIVMTLVTISYAQWTLRRSIGISS